MTGDPQIQKKLEDLVSDETFSAVSIVKKDLAARGLTVTRETQDELTVTGFSDGETRTVRVVAVP